ncbi:protein LONGIFOLIA 1 isoform X1 [Carica papaya]|uniref:protein LONGIFOLIA 1 isoform X1 n=1 Tax=Carica papaya TaxID=3649 RepID=UPI000B8CF573|nr:protein LONGIFOLIA 1 isoform X1 [Carica papaya]
MAAKLLHSLADDNPDLQKQIGCMTGIFQLFDRHHNLTGRRLSHRRLSAPGSSHFNSNGFERESNNPYNQSIATETNVNRSVNEKQRTSTESSRPSFSSTCSSSLSSSECNKMTQQEASAFERTIFPGTPSREPVIHQASSFPHLGLQSPDLRDVVKDSMYREVRGLSVKTTTKEEIKGQAMKHKDSPRPIQPSKSVDRSHGAGLSDVDIEESESLRVLAKLREAPRCYTEAKEVRRSSYEAKDRSWHSIAKDAPRFSYDGRETNRLSFESRDSCKSVPKLKELPRLSLDSREGSVRGSNSESNAGYLSRSFQNSVNSGNEVPSPRGLLGSQKRPAGVVAKLMGLETLPDSASASDNDLHLIKTGPIEDGNPFSRALRRDLNRPIRTSPSSPRSSFKDPASPRWKNPDLIMKPISSSKFPIESAPWRQLDGIRNSQKPAFSVVKVQERTSNSSSPSIYSEIQKKLNDLEVKGSGKDLGALKQILEAMQEKGFLETKKEQPLTFRARNGYEPKSVVLSQNSKGQHSRSNESPIVIMKPAKLVDKAGMPASSVIPIDSFSDLNKLQIHAAVDSKRSSRNSRTAKDKSPRNMLNDFSISSVDKKLSSRSIRSSQSSTKPQQLSKESAATSVKNSGSTSPRLQQKKLELDKRSRPPTPPSDSSKPRRQSNRHLTESSSPGGKLRSKSRDLQRSDDQLSQISNESRSSSYQGDDASLHSDSSTVLEPKVDTEVASTEQSVEVNSNQSPSLKAEKYSVSTSMEKVSAPRLSQDGSLAEFATVPPEHPSPVSVLDTLLYRDDAPSPVKQMQGGDGARGSTDNHNERWIPFADFASSKVSGLTSEMNHKKLQNIENLVQKLRRLNSSHDEARTDYIASLCENPNPDHRYISEILLASGLLLRDLGSGLATFQLDPSGHPINPELFFVLEQTKARNMHSKEESILRKASNSKSDQEKFHRKLIFDTVNEVLVQKLALLGVNSEPYLKSDKLAKKTLNAQKFLKELCQEMEQVEGWKAVWDLEEEEDGLKGILTEDVMHRSESWTDFSCEVPGVVLDVERLVFKDLVNEIVIGEAAGTKTRQGKCRQLFIK